MGLFDQIDLGALADVLGYGAAGRASGRFQQATAQNAYDRNALSKYLAELEGQQTDLAQRRFALTAPAARAGLATRGDILANAQDVNLTNLPPGVTMAHLTGGLRPSVLSPESRQLGQQMTRDALVNQMKGDTFGPAPTPPTLTPLPTSGTWDTILNTGATGAGILGALFGGKGGSGGSGTDFDLGKAADWIKQLFHRGSTPPPWLDPHRGFMPPDDPNVPWLNPAKGYMPMDDPWTWDQINRIEGGTSGQPDWWKNLPSSSPYF